MKVKTKHSVIHTLTLDDSIEVKIDFEPIESTILTERVGDKLVVGYLVQDGGHGCNPLEDQDGNGKIYLRGRDQFERGDDQRMLYALKITDYGGPDDEHRFALDERAVTLRELAEE